MLLRAWRHGDSTVTSLYGTVKEKVCARMEKIIKRVMWAAKDANAPPPPMDRQLAGLQRHTAGHDFDHVYPGRRRERASASGACCAACGVTLAAKWRQPDSRLCSGQGTMASTWRQCDSTLTAGWRTRAREWPLLPCPLYTPYPALYSSSLLRVNFSPWVKFSPEY
jgi:hypothetical protein